MRTGFLPRNDTLGVLFETAINIIAILLISCRIRFSLYINHIPLWCLTTEISLLEEKTSKDEETRCQKNSFFSQSCNHPKSLKMSKQCIFFDSLNEQLSRNANFSGTVEQI